MFVAHVVFGIQEIGKIDFESPLVHMYSRMEGYMYRRLLKGRSIECQ